MKMSTPGAIAGNSALESTASLTSRLLKALSAQVRQALPQNVVELTKSCILDYIGVALAGSAHPAVKLLIEHEQQLRPGSQRTLGGAGGLSSAGVALVNCVAGHILDYDDVLPMMPGHLSVVILPALLAVAEDRQVTGADFIEAFVFGYELGARVAALLGAGHYRRGFHITATVGTFASAAACARLMGLDEHQFVRALGIAGTRAAGLKGAFGTDAKAYQVGKAAQDGVESALLAARGFDAPDDILGADQGFVSVLGEQNEEAAATIQRETFYLSQNIFKFHASCFGTHAAIEAARKVRDEVVERDLLVTSMRLQTGSLNAKMCNISRPKNGLEAKFSLTTMIGFGLEGIDTSAVESFEDDFIARAMLKHRCDVEVGFDPALRFTQATLRAECADGTIVTAMHDAETPLEGEVARKKIEGKFASLTQSTLSAEERHQIISAIAELELRQDVWAPLNVKH